MSVRQAQTDHQSEKPQGQGRVSACGNPYPHFRRENGLARVFAVASLHIAQKEPYLSTWPAQRNAWTSFIERDVESAEKFSIQRLKQLLCLYSWLQNAVMYVFICMKISYVIFNT